jgi:hypothetical protein
MDAGESELLLSFEEWKERQLQAQLSAQAEAASRAREKEATNRSGSTTVAGNSSGVRPSGAGNADGGGAGGGEAGGGSRTATVDLAGVVPEATPGGVGGASQDVGADVQAKAQETLAPHFRIPLTDRFNYASLDCSARVHTSHKSAKSSSSILSSKRDKYMLSPCSPTGKDGRQEKTFVVVELCEDIRIDTVQLANFEFFSGVFKDFTVSVAKTYSTSEEGWTVAGTYKAKNVRAVQVSESSN